MAEMRIERIIYSASGRGLSEMAELCRHADGAQITLTMYRSPAPSGIERELRRGTQVRGLQKHVVELQADVVLPLFNLANGLELSRNVSRISARDARNYYIKFQGCLKPVTYQWISGVPRQWQELNPIIDFMETCLYDTDWNEVPAFQAVDSP